MPLILWVFITILFSDHHSEGVRHDHGRRLWFDVADVPEDNYLMMAELRLHQNPIHRKWKTTVQNSGFDRQHYEITVYLESQNEDSVRQLELLSVINTTNDYHGWLELNVTEGLSRWMQRPRILNHGFYLTLTNIDQPTKLLKFDEIGLFYPRAHEQYQPFMIGFFRGPEVGLIEAYPPE